MARPRTDSADFEAITVRLPKEIMDHYRALAEEGDRSLNAQILRVTKAWYAEEKAAGRVQGRREAAVSA